MRWTAANIPNLSGKIAIVTGANSGLGYETAYALAGRGCKVIMACRNLEKAQHAKDTIEQFIPHADIKIEELDLSSLTSITTFCNNVKKSHNRIDILINNAAILNTMPGQKTKEGFELIMGINHLGTFTLTAQLLPLLEASSHARIVTVSSDSHKFVNFTLNDVTNPSSSQHLKTYAKSKLANLIFVFELANRLNIANSKIICVAAHPGFAATSLSDAKDSGSSTRFASFIHLGMRLFAQTATQGALPILYAATAEQVKNGEFYGPDGWTGIKGYPTKQRAAKAAYDTNLAHQLWDLSERLTNTKFTIHHNPILETEQSEETPKSTEKMLSLLNQALIKAKLNPINNSNYLFYSQPVDIKASGATIWKLMTDINHYKDISHAAIDAHLEDNLVAGNSIKLKLFPDSNKGKLIPAVTEKITVVDEEAKILGWSLPLPQGLGCTQRYHVIEPINDNKCHSYIVDHIPSAVGFFSNLFIRKTINESFTQLNHGFKERAESLETENPRIRLG
ncbi:retinol dehydrogenase [Legionella busanensis]|uniref:Retinol dehydrogenase n=1 Tax=Legionella busanensis TaxID=190655 RepID=A0A378JK14_9GAMM|nr:oxidoreductase [Legionella busanensis]STX51565.1 retinol dehydrogenase [Legionella busanensis]